jgi:hypothetical protein
VSVWRRRLAIGAIAAVALAGCGSSPSAAPTTTSTTTARTAEFTYGPTPSVSARMLCRDETIDDIAHVLGVTTTSPPTATWRHHKYTCPYRYADGTMELSVQALPTLPATRAYMVALGRVLGNTGAVGDVGQGAFMTRDGSVVSRKDNKVLVVDVARLPAQFGHPATSRADIALTVTDVIFACWRGD